MPVAVRYFQHEEHQHVLFGAPLEFVPLGVAWAFIPVFI